MLEEQIVTTITDVSNTVKGIGELLNSIVHRLLEIERRLDKLEEKTMHGV